VQAEVRRRRWAADPVAWASERLRVHLWSRQAEIMRAVAAHRSTAVATCHEIGKSFSAALLAAWWIDTHKAGEAFVVTTAPTAPQVRVILWKEIGRAHARGGLPGRVNQTEWLLRVNGKEEVVGMGRKPNDYSPTAFQGIHGAFVLFIGDESNGIRGNLWDAADSLTANDGSKRLAIGNPDFPEGEFHGFCQPGSGWRVIHVSAFDSPNFTGEPCPEAVRRELIGPRYVEEKRAKWAPQWRWRTADGRDAAPGQPGARCVPPSEAEEWATHPFWQSKVLGRFPAQTGTGSLIAPHWVRAAQAAELVTDEEWRREPGELALDVGASEDGDPSCLARRVRGRVRVLWERREPDTMRTSGALLQAMRDPGLPAGIAKVDYIGVGRGACDSAMAEEPGRVVPLQVSERSTVLQCRACKHEWDVTAIPTERCPRCGCAETLSPFRSLGDQLWWEARGMFERGEVDIDPADEELAAELLTLTWAPNQKGQTVVEYAKGPSPNRADALMIALAREAAARGALAPRDWAGHGLTSAVTW
jgi:hypothetical protein